MTTVTAPSSRTASRTHSRQRGFGVHRLGLDLHGHPQPVDEPAAPTTTSPASTRRRRSPYGQRRCRCLCRLASVWSNPARSATAALVLGIVTIVSCVMWYSLAPTMFGLGAMALALHARADLVRWAKTTVALVLGAIGVAVSVIFVIGSFVSFLTNWNLFKRRPSRERLQVAHVDAATTSAIVCASSSGVRPSTSSSQVGRFRCTALRDHRTRHATRRGGRRRATADPSSIANSRREQLDRGTQVDDECSLAHEAPRIGIEDHPSGNPGDQRRR